MKHAILTSLLFTTALLVGACCSAPKNAAPEPTPTEPTPVEPIPADPIPTEPTPVVTTPVETGAMCGGIAGIACPEGAFCDMAGHCGAADQSGVCVAVPTMCTRDYRPVCGCDGQTYGNACTAHAARVSVFAQGECKAP